MISSDELVKDFLRGRAVHLAILNSQCFEYFFDKDDMLFEKIKDIYSVSFLYVNSSNNPIGCPTIKCKINYKNRTTLNHYFIYDEVIDVQDVIEFENRLRSYASYFDDYLERFKEKKESHKLDLEFSDLFHFVENTSCMHRYMNILNDIDSKFKIVNKGDECIKLM